MILACNLIRLPGKLAGVLLLAALALTLNGCSGSSTADPPPGKSAAELISAGDKLLADGKLDDALAAFDGAVDSSSDSGAGAQRRGLAYLRLGKLERAIDDCNAALRLNGKLADAYLVRGQAEKQSGDAAKAAADFSEALENSPDRADVLTARLRSYQQMAGTGVDREQAQNGWIPR